MAPACSATSKPGNAVAAVTALIAGAEVVSECASSGIAANNTPLPSDEIAVAVQSREYPEPSGGVASRVDGFFRRPSRRTPSP